MIRLLLFVFVGLPIILIVATQNVAFLGIVILLALVFAARQVVKQS